MKQERSKGRSAAEFLPDKPTLTTLREASEGCTGCDIFKNATQTVFGEGPQTATVILIGEQPGDQEDRAGHPFVGPAGQLLDKALRQAGITREETYVTNAVKHFKWEPQGRRRKHKRPSASEVTACRPWLEAEVNVIRPRIVVCLGATAAQSVFGRVVRINEMRGRFHEIMWGNEPFLAFVTVHPSAIFRIPEEAQQTAEYERLVADLRLVADKLREAT
jgi:uracil-DNA glycosylase family protein